MISILMASYNGEKYISDQIASVLNQSMRDFILYIRDDCSTDSTYDIIADFAAKYPDKIKTARSESNTGSAKHNFMDMMLKYRDEYIMLCDQDDVWLPDKIKLSLDKMKEMENRYGKAVPLLLHTDLRVVDESLRAIHPSLKGMIGTADIRCLKWLTLQNHVTGNTVMYNNALAKLIRPPAGDFVMHDWWLAMICMCFGNIEALEEKTVLYRQHGNNEVGAKSVKSLSYCIRKITHGSEIREAMRSSYRQCASFLKTYGEELAEDQRTLLSICEKMTRSGKLGRLLLLRKDGLFRKSAIRKISQIFYG